MGKIKPVRDPILMFVYRRWTRIKAKILRRGIDFIFN